MAGMFSWYTYLLLHYIYIIIIMCIFISLLQWLVCLVGIHIYYYTMRNIFDIFIYKHTHVLVHVYLLLCVSVVFVQKKHVSMFIFIVARVTAILIIIDVH